MKRLSVLLAGFLLSLCTACPVGATVLFQQVAANTSAWTSQTANGTNGFNQAWDNFTLAAPGTVTDVAWTGWVLPSFGQINGFTICFYSDSVDGTTHTPGTLIYSKFISGNANETAVGSHNAFGIFDFNASVPFVASANTEYWISIMADPQNTLWNWANSHGGDSSFYEDDQNGTVGPVGTDLAFTLSNTSAAPEPSSLVLAGSGVLALVGTARRRVVRR